VPKTRFNLNDPRYGFAFLIQELARQMRRTFLERAAKSGLTQVQARALAVIYRHEGATQIEVSRILDIQPMTFARMLDRMERAGLIERRRDPDDRRVFRIHLASRAGPVLELMADVSEDIRAQSLEGFVPAEHDLLVRYLERLKANMAQVQSGSPGRRSRGQRLGAA
jgi:MarR family transcriptional regulator for hemolysin